MALAPFLADSPIERLVAPRLHQLSARMDASGTETQQAELLERLRAGNRAAQEQLFRSCRRWLFRQALRVEGNPALAEEVVHEAWIRAMESLGSFQGQSSLRTWIASIVRNQARSQRRKEARFHPVPFGGSHDRADWQAHDGEERDATAHRHTQETPEALLLEKEAAERIERALNLLSRSLRSVLELRDFQGASSKETCDALAITDRTQRVRLSRARATLRRALG